ncbi:MAG: GLPGLI family protein, partial [Bacteroidetes bacterium]|nr:GLPGLI family protein [Bacteroidota bacterium]
MKKILFFLLFSTIVFAQSYRITYKTSFEGKERPNQDPIVVFANSKENFILSEAIIKKEKKIPFELSNTTTGKFSTTTFGFLPNQEIVATTTDKAVSTFVFSLKDDTKKILGFLCKKAVTTVNSNTIEVWYTKELGVFAGPSLIGQNLGLVLETVRNGSTVTQATAIKKEKSFDISSIFNLKSAKYTDALSYKDQLWRSKFLTIDVFKEQSINFSDESKSDEIIKRYGNGTIILRK